jgi:outer membrane protein OmpA-like peptidoglycan-associated protein
MRVKRTGMRSLYCLLLVASCFAASAQQSQDTLLIHFDYNQSLITPRSATVLDSFLQSSPKAAITQVSLSGHCDFIGSHAYNDSLSQQRVLSTKTYLVNKGLSPTLFGQSAGMGKRVPLLTAATDAARAINRRVAIVFVKQPPVVVTAPKEETPKTGPVRDTNKLNLSAIINDTATKVGSTLVLPDLNFEPGRHYLLSGSYGILRELYRVMKDNPTLRIEIQGHICCISGGADGPDVDTGAPDLSVQRAKAIYTYLVTAGIAANRMEYKGFGSSKKLYPIERSSWEETKNRRVEIRIISK